MGRDLDIKKLKGSIQALKDSVDVYNECNTPNSILNNEKLLKRLRSAIIKDFEVANEQCWKFMQRWINLNVGPNELKGKFRRELFAVAKENALIDDAELWMGFNEARNSTAHIYDEEIAEEIFETALEFLPHAEKFAETMEGNI